MPKKMNIKEDPKAMDPYFQNFEANKKLLLLTDEILNQFFSQTKYIRQDEDERDIMTLHNFFGSHVWTPAAKSTMMDVMTRMRRAEFQEIRDEFEK